MRILTAHIVTLVLVVGAGASCSGPADESGAAERKGTCQGVSCNLEALLKDSEQREPWRVHEAKSFRIFSYDDQLASRVAYEAERQRLRQLQEWLGTGTTGTILPWSPRCDIYLYPNMRLLVKLSGGSPKAGAAHSSPSRLYRGRIVSRRIDLAADDRHLFNSTLPHEISHVVVQALLSRDVPLWAHEGLAMLEEPEEFHEERRELVAAELGEGRAYPVKAVMEMNRYPDQEYVRLFYAQSFCLTQLLVQAKGRPAFLAFLRDARPGLMELALRQHYGWGYPELQRRWEASLRGW